MKTVIAVLVATLALAGCSSPCHDYCQAFVDKTSSCGLGGPSGDSAVDSCSDEVSKTLTHDACSTAHNTIEDLDCKSFQSLVCAQPNAKLTYKCN
jgi:hypothetical protein